jgi:hypothetical protein
MKRAVFALMILVMLSTTAAAGEISYGVKGGLFTANMTAIPAGWDDTAFKNGLAGGVYINYAFNENLSLQPEVLYVMKGLDGVITNPIFTVDFTGEYNYIEIPLLARYTIPTQSGFSAFFFVGPSLEINVAADLELDGIDHRTRVPLTGSVDYSDLTRKTGGSFIFGAGCALGVGPGRITLDARFDIGLTKVIKGGTSTLVLNGQSSPWVEREAEAKHLGFALLVGYAF